MKLLVLRDTSPFRREAKRQQVRDSVRELWRPSAGPAAIPVVVVPSVIVPSSATSDDRRYLEGFRTLSAV